MTIDGPGPCQNAEKLKSEQILVPSAHLAKHGEGVNKSKVLKDIYGRRVSKYVCSQYTKVPCGTFCKSEHRINEKVVMEPVSDLLKVIAEYAKHDKAWFIRAVQEAQDTQQTQDIRRRKSRLAAYEKNRKSAEKFIALIDKYEDFDHLTVAMLNEFVGKRSTAGSRLQTRQFHSVTKRRLFPIG